MRRFLDPAVSGTHYIHAGMIGWTLADSINFDAEKVILCIGDSKWNGTGPTTVLKCIPWLINDFYRAKGIDSRYILPPDYGRDTYRRKRNRTPACSSVYAADRPC